MIITKKFSWDMAHRIPEHEGKCRHLHGHTYSAEFAIAGKIQENGAGRGMVCDYDKFKIIKEFIDKNLDHKCMLFKEDYVLTFLNSDVVDFGRLGILTVDFIPTAEEIAVFLFEVLVDRVREIPGCELASVTVFETPNTSAKYYAPSTI